MTVLNALVRCRRSIGRRGYALLVFALVDFVYGASLAFPTEETRAIAQYAYAGTILPLRVWGVMWVAVGVVCLVQSWMRRDQIAFTAAIVIKVAWSLLAAIGWMSGELPRGYLSAVIWATFAGLVAVILSWPEPTPRFASVAEALISADSKGRITAWNSAAVRLFGWSAHEILGKPLSVVIPAELRDAHEEGFRQAVRERRSDLVGRVLPLQAIRRDGRRFPVELTISLWESGEDVTFTGLIRDMSAARSVR